MQKKEAIIDLDEEYERNQSIVRYPKSRKLPS